MTNQNYDDAIGMALNQFDALIQRYAMKCQYYAISIDDSHLILESWISESNPFFSLNRFYSVYSDNLTKIAPRKRKKLLREILAREVEAENYEQAALVRDLIRAIKK